MRLAVAVCVCVCVYLLVTVCRAMYPTVVLKKTKNTITHLHMQTHTTNHQQKKNSTAASGRGLHLNEP